MLAAVIGCLYPGGTISHKLTTSNAFYLHQETPAKQWDSL
jgi:hypothetical protein